MVLLYLHSYQSLLWNKIVSERIKKYGLNPIVGDLVFKDNAMANAPAEVIDGEDEEEASANGTRCLEVETISEENLSKYTIFDIIYPLPGCDIRYPDNEIGKWYIDLLAEDGLTSEKLMKKNKYNILIIFFIGISFKYCLLFMCSIFRLFSLKGTYRTIVSKAEDIVWSIIKHNDLNDDLLLSDIEIMENKQPFTSVAGT